MSTIAQVLKNLREEKGLTRQDIVKHYNCHPLIVNDIENGKIPVNRGVIPAYAKAAGVSEASILDQVDSLEI